MNTIALTLLHVGSGVDRNSGSLVVLPEVMESTVSLCWMKSTVAAEGDVFL